jgi:hypothetical protein
MACSMQCEIDFSEPRACLHSEPRVRISRRTDLGEMPLTLMQAYENIMTSMD